MSGFPQPMHRRHFLAGAATGLTALGLTTASTARAAPLPSPPTTWTQALLDADPRLIAFVNGTEHDQAARIEGRLPRGLAGVLYRNGPGLFERGSDRYRHWFDGDGLIQRWSIGPQGVSYRSRFAATPKFRTEHKAGQFVLPVSGGGIRPAAAFAGANSVNPSNTAVLPVNGALWALWEGAARCNSILPAWPPGTMLIWVTEQAARRSAPTRGSEPMAGSGTSARSAAGCCFTGWIKPGGWRRPGCSRLVSPAITTTSS